MAKKPPTIFEIVSPKIWAEEFADKPGSKAYCSAQVQSPYWTALSRVARSQNAQEPARLRAEAEAQRITNVEWEKGSKTIDSMAKDIAAQLAATGFLKKDGTPWSAKAVRSWIVKLAPSHKPGRPRDA